MCHSERLLLVTAEGMQPSWHGCIAGGRVMLSRQKVTSNVLPLHHALNGKKKWDPDRVFITHSAIFHTTVLQVNNIKPKRCWD